MTSARSFPSFDLSKLDVSKLDLSKLDLSKLDLSKLGLSRFVVRNPQVDELATKVAGVVRDAAYVVIGFGVLTVQQVQVRRRELVKSLSDNAAMKQLGVSREQIEHLVATLEARVSQLDAKVAPILDTFEARVDSAVEAAVERLPEQAGSLVTQAHHIAQAARKQARGFLRSAA